MGLRTPSFLMVFECRTFKERKRRRLDRLSKRPKKIDLKADKMFLKTNEKIKFQKEKKTIMLTVRARTSSSLYNMIQAHIARHEAHAYIHVGSQTCKHARSKRRGDFMKFLQTKLRLIANIF